MKKLLKKVVTFLSNEFLNKENSYVLGYDKSAERWKITKVESKSLLAEDRPKIPRINEGDGEA